MRGQRLGWVTAASVALALAGCTAVEQLVGEWSVDIGQDTLQQRLQARFPINKCQVACVELSQPVVSLTSGSERMGLAATVDVAMGQVHLPGHLALSGTLRYEPADGNFFFEQIQVHELQIQGLPRALAQSARQQAPRLIAAAMQGHPVYSLSQAGQHGDWAKWAIRDVKVVDGKLRIVLRRL